MTDRKLDFNMSFHSYMHLLAQKHREIYENSIRSISVPLLFTMGQSILVSWSPTNAYVLASCP